MKLTPSGSQTVGPFFRIGLEHLYARDTESTDNAEKVTIRGKVLDADGNPVPDAMLEVWHASKGGLYNALQSDSSHRPACFTRIATDDNGTFRFTIVRLGPVACAAQSQQAPHIAILVFARGLLRHLTTRMYFPDDPANDSDPVMQLIPPERRHTLIAQQNANSPGSFEWNVVLQGQDETVFFAC